MDTNFDPIFKRKIVSFIIEHDCRVKDVAEGLGISSRLIFLWLRGYHGPLSKTSAKDRYYLQEIKRLRVENARLAEECHRLQDRAQDPEKKVGSTIE